MEDRKRNKKNDLILELVLCTNYVISDIFRLKSVDMLSLCATYILKQY
jgi:hypothetical protein